MRASQEISGETKPASIDGGGGSGGRQGGWLARHRTIEKMSAPHRLDIFKHGHRAVCSGVLISSFLVVEVEACSLVVGFESDQG